MKKKYSDGNLSKIAKQWRSLRADIAMHDRLYYKENSPKISDFEYDCLKAELFRIEQVATNFGIKIKEDGVGNDLLSGFKKISHLTPMKSLANTYSYNELIEFDKKISKQLNHANYSYVVEPKIDGVAINLIYENGNLKHALTRGDGTIGDDVTDNILTIDELPKHMDQCPAKLEIRGEVLMDEQTFNLANEAQRTNGLEEYANPRNLAAGTIKSLDPNDVKKRNLKVIVYAIGYSSEDIFHEQSDVLKQLSKWGFRSQEKYWIAANIVEAWECVSQLDSVRKNFSYWTDGAVLKINELSLHNALGSTAKAPRWAMAYKFTPTRVSTKLKNIILQVGRTGIVTPVAILEPIEVDGSIVSRATLHNGSEIEKKDIRIGDYVFLEKAGEIIPAVVSVDLEKRSKECKPFIFPTKCPSCGHDLKRLESEVAWRCVNGKCKEQIKCKIMYFASKEAMDISNFGEAIIEKLIENGRLETLDDIYKLSYSDLEGLQKFGQKSALKILDNIDASKVRPLWRLINGLGIFGVGLQTAKDLAKNFSSIGELAEATVEQLTIIPGIGEKVANAICAFFNGELTKKMLKNFASCKISLSQQQTHNQRNIKIFNDKIFILTGTLRNFTREQAMEIIESLGGKIVNSVSKKTEIMICGENAGSKLQRAKNLAIEIWSEDKFIGEANLESKYKIN